MIFDLASAGGTWVNGKRVQQSKLTSGDLISLAGLPLVYKRDPDLQKRMDTQDLGFTESG
jgi:pSer/pThr/pTyr-binding forkhead associated (FHA) protein